MLKFIFIGIGGAIGASLRYFVDYTITQNHLMSFPLGTLMVNLIGCFFIGIAFKIFYHEVIHIRFNPFIITGFLGALTTFSTYAYTTLILLEKKSYLLAGFNLLVNNIFGILFAYLGLELTDFIIKKYFNHNYKEREDL